MYFMALLGRWGGPQWFASTGVSETGGKLRHAGHTARTTGTSPQRPRRAQKSYATYHRTRTGRADREGRQGRQGRKGLLPRREPEPQRALKEFGNILGEASYTDASRGSCKKYNFIEEFLDEPRKQPKCFRKVLTEGVLGDLRVHCVLGGRLLPLGRPPKAGRRALCAPRRSLRSAVATPHDSVH